MAWKDARTVNPSPSDVAHDKLYAALNWDRTGSETALSAEYHEACVIWFMSLSEDDRWRAAMVRQAHDRGRHGDAEQLAAALPPAPVFPFSKP